MSKADEKDMLEVTTSVPVTSEVPKQWMEQFHYTMPIDLMNLLGH